MGLAGKKLKLIVKEIIVEKITLFGFLENLRVFKYYDDPENRKKKLTPKIGFGFRVTWLNKLDQPETDKNGNLITHRKYGRMVSVFEDFWVKLVAQKFGLVIETVAKMSDEALVELNNQYASATDGETGDKIEPVFVEGYGKADTYKNERGGFDPTFKVVAQKVSFLDI